MAIKRNNYFRNVPLVQYNYHQMRNILLSAAITRTILNNVTAYIPFIVSEGEQPDDVAFNYYGESSYAWLVLLSNDIVDPYYEWPLDQKDFDRYIAKKYGTVAAAQAEISHYQNPDYKYHMTPATFTYTTPGERTGWTAVYAYDYEFVKNEQKRRIRLIDARYKQQLERELQKVFKRDVR